MKGDTMSESCRTTTRRRDTHHWRARWAASSLLALAVTGLSLPAEAAVTTVPELPRNIVVFPERDFLVLEGYPVGTRVDVEVVRAGVVIGTAEVLTGSGAESAEINHPGGDCWLGATPDIRAGDELRAVESVDVDGEQHGQGSHVMDVWAEPAVVEGTDVVVRGTARDRAGGPVPVELLEQRIINPDFTEIASIGRRDIRATADGAELGTLAYDAPGSVHWTARYTGLGAEARQVALDGQTRILSWLETAADGERIGITIFEVGESAGPGMPECPPLADYAVQRTDPAAVNAATVGRDLVVHGTSYRAESVTVELDDGDSTTPPLVGSTTTFDGGDFQAWSVDFDAAAVAGLADGTLSLEASYTLSGGSIAGRPLTVLKDVSPPDAPVSSPPGGTYAEPVLVSLSTEPGAEVYLTLDGSTPTRQDLPYSRPVSVTADATLKAIAFDAAGNPGAVSSDDYVIGSYLEPADDPGTPDPGPGTEVVPLSQPPRLPRNLVIFPERDFVTIEGYEAEAGETLEVRVIRGEVEVGRSIVTAAAGDPSAEVNHPGGACWIGSTPDLRPGDRVEVLPRTGGGDATTVLGVVATAATAPSGTTDTVVVTGTAMGADGIRLPLDRLEQRLINPDLKLTVQGRRDLRATSDGAGDGLLSYDDPADPANGRWTATYTGLAPEVVEAALAGQTRIMAWQATVGAERAGITIYEVGEAGGPGMGGCPARAEHAVTSTTPATMNAALLTGSADFTVAGVSGGAGPTAVTLTVGAEQVAADPVVDHGNGTWSATFAASSWGSLPDGDVVVRAEFAGGTPSLGLSVLKDTAVPLAPVASPGSGTYKTDQAVTLSSPDKDLVTLHWTTDNTTPGAASTLFTEQIPVTADTTLRAVAIDRAGNTSAPGVFRYLIRVSAPGVPTDVALAESSDSGVAGDGVTNDQMPELVGSASSGLTVELLDAGTVVGESVAVDGRFAVSPANALSDGAHPFTVRTRDGGGRVSDPSATLTVTIDTIAPVLSLTGPSGLISHDTPEFSFTTSEPADVKCSIAAAGSALEACTSPATYGPLTDGTYTFRARAEDTAGNVGDEVTRSFTVDTTAVPAPTPSTALPTAGQLQPSTVPVRVSWPSSTSTDLARYELHRSTDGGSSWTEVLLTGPLVTSTLLPLPPGPTVHQFKVVTVDSAGNTAEALGAPFTVAAAQETSAEVTYSPAATSTRWRTATLTGAFGGSVRHDSTANATASYAFTGTSVQWVTTLGPDRGRADVFVDGVRVATAVELHSRTTQTRRIMFAANGLTPGAHTLTIRVTGTKLGKSKGTRVDVDAFTSLG
ncbi:MAG: chitobiase/beta-hexosaminidase C-terminal domain-containing protein [Actinomycetes bacterium]